MKISRLMISLQAIKTFSTVRKQFFHPPREPRQPDKKRFRLPKLIGPITIIEAPVDASYSVNFTLYRRNIWSINELDRFGRQHVLSSVSKVILTVRQERKLMKVIENQRRFVYVDGILLLGDCIAQIGRASC